MLRWLIFLFLLVAFNPQVRSQCDVQVIVDYEEPTCSTCMDGTLDVTIMGGCTPYSFEVSGPGGFYSSNPSLVGLDFGDYTVCVWDCDECFVCNGSFYSLQAYVSLPDCNNECEGVALAGPDLIDPSYSFEWSN